jgi:hypothetical protein
MTSAKEQKLEPKNYNVVLNWFEELKQRVSLDD